MLSGNFICRKDLIDSYEADSIFIEIRNYLAGNLAGTTKDDLLVEQMLFLLICKLKDEQETKFEEPVFFQTKYPNQLTLKQRINILFKEIHKKYPTIMEPRDEIKFDDKSLEFVVSKLENISIVSKKETIFRVLFERFMGSNLRGDKGQFFTPAPIIKLLLGLIDSNNNIKILDPACGTGDILINAFLNGYNSIWGIEKDSFLAKITQLYLILLGSNNKRIIEGNALSTYQSWSDQLKININFNFFDLILVNPPFGAKIPVNDKEILQQFQLGFKWQKDPNTGDWQKVALRESQAPQILFIERCLEFLKSGGKMIIILPEGVLSNPSDRYIIQFILKCSTILAIISCPQATFLPYTFVKTNILILEKSPPPVNYSFFMGIIESIKLYDKDNNSDISKVINNYKIYLKNSGSLPDSSKFGFVLNINELKNLILIPEYYNPDIKNQLKEINKDKFELIRFGDLVKAKIIKVNRGHEIGVKSYGTGEIPFIRTSDIFNWEINLNPIKKVSEEIWNKYKDKQDIQAGDILFVNDGTFLIGRCALVTPYETKILIQSHIRKFRVNFNSEFFNEYLLFWALNTEICQNQIKSKIFIQATISTLGNRINELLLPIPKDSNLKKNLIKQTKKILLKKAQLKSNFAKLLRI